MIYYYWTFYRKNNNLKYKVYNRIFHDIMMYTGKQLNGTMSRNTINVFHLYITTNCSLLAQH